MTHMSATIFFLLIAFSSAQIFDCNRRGIPQLDRTCNCFPPFTGQNCELFTSPLICESIGNNMFTLRPPTYASLANPLSEKECNILRVVTNSIVCGDVFACFKQFDKTYSLYYNVSTSESRENAIKHINNFLSDDDVVGSGEGDNSSQIIFVNNGTVILSIDLTFDRCTELSKKIDINDSDFSYPCDFFPCKNGGTCENVNVVDYKCKCRSGWRGETCNERNVCSFKGSGRAYCKNGGKCSYENNLPVCECRKGWMGSQCNVKNYCDQNTPYCANGGKCRYSQSKPVCDCSVGYYGQKCVCKRSDMVTKDACLARTDCPKKTKPQFYKETKNGCKNECRCVKK